MDTYKKCKLAKEVHDMVQSQFRNSFDLLLICYKACDPKNENKRADLKEWNDAQWLVGEKFQCIVRNEFDGSLPNFVKCYNECGFKDSYINLLTPPPIPPFLVNNSSCNLGQPERPTITGPGEVTGSGQITGAKNAATPADEDDDDFLEIVWESHAKDPPHLSTSSALIDDNQPSTSRAHFERLDKSPRAGRVAPAPAPEQTNQRRRTRHIFTGTQDRILWEILKGEGIVQGVDHRLARLTSAMIPQITRQVNDATRAKKGAELNEQEDLLTERQVLDWYHNRKIKVPKERCPRGFEQRLLEARNRANHPQESPNPVPLANPLPEQVEESMDEPIMSPITAELVNTLVEMGNKDK